MTHTQANRFKKNLIVKNLSKTTNGKFQGEYIARMEEGKLP